MRISYSLARIYGAVIQSPSCDHIFVVLALELWIRSPVPFDNRKRKQKVKPPPYLAGFEKISTVPVESIVSAVKGEFAHGLDGWFVLRHSCPNNYPET
jgi:hypothetical protein